MTHPSKRKGNEFERRVVRMAEASGLEARRAYASNGEALGLHATVDVEIEGYAVQCKCRRAIADYLKPTDENDVVAIRENYGEDLVVMRYADFLDLLKIAKEAEISRGGK